MGTALGIAGIVVLGLLVLLTLVGYLSGREAREDSAAGDALPQANPSEQPQMRFGADAEPDLDTRFALACGANLAFRNGQYLNQLATGLSEGESANLLRDWWAIENKNQLIETIRWLEQQGHRQDYHQAIQNRMPPALAALEVLPAAGVQLIHDERIPVNCVAWDLGRVINLARWGLESGYLSIEEATPIFQFNGKLLRQTYSGWGELSAGYMMGWFLWKQQVVGEGQDLAKDPELSLLAAQHKILLEHAQSPWNDETLSWASVDPLMH